MSLSVFALKIVKLSALLLYKKAIQVEKQEKESFSYNDPQNAVVADALGATLFEFVEPFTAILRSCARVSKDNTTARKYLSSGILVLEIYTELL